ncbi:hypothetical protein BDY24DRAFT_245957 [Mrakia frigida]|uniref:uncharacterized protein n=1 Tax=Mrakia frigida TaxID=29902 RepID=UPI003FCC2737
MACVPILIGCSTRITSEDGDNPPRICAKCNNASVTKAKSRTWFEAFCIPLFPFTNKKIYRCSICGWEIKQGAGFEPPVAGHPGFAPQQQQGYPPQGYVPNQMPKPPGR